MGRNILVVSTVHDAEDAVSPYIADDDTIKVVMPVVRQGALDWLANDEKAYAKAERAAADTAERLPGDTADTSFVDSDVRSAIDDALATFAADEIIIAVRPGSDEGPIESAATDTAPREEIRGVPVRYLVVGT
jgi:hypothetical protein